MPAKTGRLRTSYVTFVDRLCYPHPHSILLSPTIQQQAVVNYKRRMADNPNERRSKIPQYVRTTTPIVSIEYRKVLKEIKTKRLEIEVKEQKLEHLKNALPASEKERDILMAPRPSSSRTREEEKTSPIGLLGSKIRSTIFSPGGTKRKGTHITSFYS